MQSTPPPPLQWSGDLPATAATPSASASATPRARHRLAPLTLCAVLAAAAALVGVLLGGRVSAEDGIAAAREALQAGDAGRAVSLDEAITSRSGLLMVFDPGARSAARHDGQLARIAWARQLGGAGNVDGAVAALKQVGEPGLLSAAAQARTEILLNAATAAVQGGRASLALQRLDQARVGAEPASTLSRIAALRADAEVSAAGQLVAAGHSEDALTLLDDASATGAAAAAAPLYPRALLASARDQVAALDFAGAAANAQKLVDHYRSSPEALTARSLLRAPQSVSGTLVDSAGHGAAGRVRLASHYAAVSGGYSTSGPFYYGSADVAGNFDLTGVGVGGPYVLEYYRAGGWQTLVDPRTDQPANPVTVKPMIPVDLTFIVIPG